MKALPAIRAAFESTLACFAFASGAAAQETAAPEAVAPDSAKKDDAASPWSFTLSLTATNAYFFRCIPEEDRGAIVQPAFEIDYLLHEGDDALKEAGIGLGTFDSFHSGPTGTGGNTAESPKAWYEADLYLTAYGKLDHGIELTTTLYEYTSPNSQFDPITEIDVCVAWDDGYLWNDAFKIHPCVTIARELRGQSEFADAPTGTHSGTWLGIGIAPEFKVAELGETGDADQSKPVALSFPVLLNLSIDDYYEDASGHDETFGGLDLGANLDVPLPFLGDSIGAWSFGLGLHYLILGDHMQAQHGGDGSQWIVSGGITLSF